MCEMAKFKRLHDDKGYGHPNERYEVKTWVDGTIIDREGIKTVAKVYGLEIGELTDEHFAKYVQAVTNNCLFRDREIYG
jgi:hypothetical protein